MVYSITKNLDKLTEAESFQARMSVNIDLKFVTSGLKLVIFLRQFNKSCLLLLLGKELGVPKFI